MVVKRAVLYSFVVFSIVLLFSMVSFAEIRVYITEDRLSTVKSYAKRTDDRVYDNFNENNIYLYWSKNLDSKYRRAIYSDGYYNDMEGGTWIDPDDESELFKSEFVIEFNEYDQHLIRTQKIYPYIKFYAAANDSGLDDTAMFDVYYDLVADDSWHKLSGFSKSKTGISSDEQWNLNGSLGTYIPTDAIKLNFRWSSEDNGDDDTAFYDIDIYFVDKTAPTVESIYTENSGTKKIGDKIQIKVRMDEKVTVGTGSRLKLNSGSNAYADFVSKTDSATCSTLLYEYTVKEGDSVATLDVSTTQTEFEEKLQDLAGNVADNVLNFAAVSIVDTKNIKIDGVRPKIQSIKSNSNNIIKTKGEEIIFTVTFTENVNITTAPTISLSNGKQLTGNTVAGKNYCEFKYVIGTSSTETSSDLKITKISGGTIKDIACNPLTNYTITGNSVSGVKIDNTKPEIIFPTPHGNTTWQKKHSITINVTDSISELVDDVYKYALVEEGSIGGITYDEIYAPGNSLPLEGLSGKYKIYVRAEDEKGNIATDDTNAYYLDNTMPDIKITADYSKPRKSHSANVVVTDKHSGIKVITYRWYKEGETLGDTGYTVWSDYFSSDNTLTFEAPADGRYRLAIRSRDNSDNLGTAESDYFYFDKTPPQISVTEKNGYAFDSNRSSYSINISASDPNGSNLDGTIQYIRYRWEDTSDEVSDSNGWITYVPGDTVIYDNGKTTGKKHLHVEVRDNAAAGQNSNKTYETYEFAFDCDGPDILATSSNFTGIYTRVSLDVSVSDTYNSVSSAVYAFREATLGENLDGLDWRELELSSGKVEQQVSLSAETGAFRLHVKAQDSEGNESYFISNQVMLDNDAGEGGVNIIETYDNNGTVNVVFNISKNSEGFTYAISEDGTTFSEFEDYIYSRQYTFEDKSEGEKTIYVKYKDALGNITDIYRDTVMIDKTPPTAQVQYSPDAAGGPTNKNVIATLINITDNISSIENISKSGTFFTFTSNGTTVFTLSDQAGNIGYITAEVNWIDRQGPVIQLDPISDLTPSKTKDASATAIKEGQAVTLSYSVVDENGAQIMESQSVNNGDTITLSGDGNQYINVTATDEIGNTTEQRFGPYILDNTPPVATITYSTESRTANNVIATAALSEGYVVNNGGMRTYIFSDNGSFTFELSDSAGNVSTLTAEVSWIDRTLPSADIIVSEANTTKDDVQVDISVESLVRARIESVMYSNDGMTLISVDTRVPEGFSGDVIYKSTYTVGKNGTMTIVILDIDTLQETTYTVNINNIDKEPPSCSFYLSETERTRNDIEVTVLYSDLFSNPSIMMPHVSENVESIGDNKFRITENGTYKFTVTDALGNQGTYDLIIDNIDRVIYPQITYSTTDFTNQDVVCTIYSPDEELFAINNNESLSYTFTQNGTFTFEVKDSAGNIAEVMIVVDWINKEGVNVLLTPSQKKITNQNIVITVEPIDSIENLTSVEGLVPVEGKDNEFIVSENGIYTFEILDIYGNVISRSISVVNIDKTPPELSYTVEVDIITGRQYLQEGEELPMTAKPIRVTFSCNEEYEFISIPIGVSIDRLYNIATIKENGSYDFVVRDRAGNEASKTITLSNFDTTPPVVTVSYSTLEKTNRDVVATLSGEEEIKVINNFNSPKKVFKENGTFVFNVSDIAGNEIEVTAIVENIDKKPPAVSLTYSTLEPTKGNVILTISADEDFMVKNNGGKTTYTFTENATVYFVVADLLGNETMVEAKVTNIDKTAPTIIVLGDTPILVPLNEKNFDFSSYAYVDSYEDSKRPILVNTSGVDFTKAGKYKVVYSVTDEVGNTATVEKDVDVVDVSVPLGVRINGLDPEKTDVLRGEHIIITLFNVFDYESIYYLPEKVSITKVKAIGEKLNGKVIEVEKNGWYSILIMDKDANYRFYQVFITK